ncbi:TetR/AcrR family transcriptional regulator [Nocardioides sambongensis]|uniref:TetR/AcrR family transcriptional regulator n=1 Tax=Nocardioides sambongensis TaxID=2589074 RepID=UPI00112B8D22|nr:TetR/AcrR family transcriptional regulator [Nocardioides sambongensis]
MAQRERARPQQDRAVHTRALLMATAVTILETEGADRLSTAAVSRRAHLSSGTFYRYFNDRSDLLAALREQMVAAIKDDLMEAVVEALDLDVEPALRLVVTTLVDGFEEHRGVLLALVDQAPAGTNANLLPEIERDLRRLAALLPRRHLRDLPADQLDGVVFMLMGVLVSTCLRIALTPPPGVSRERLVDLAVAMVGAGFRS